MPESRSTILMDKEAKRRRKSGEDPNVYGPNEVKQPRINIKEFGITWMRPFEMFVREPIVLSMSLLSGFSDALIFTFTEAFPLVYEQWGFSTLSQGWTFIPIVIGYFLAYLTYMPWIAKDRRFIKKYGEDALIPESRLYWLLFLAPLLSIGLFGFAWTSLGPPQVHWIGESRRRYSKLPFVDNITDASCLAPMIFSVCVAVANYAIYMSTIDYMVAAYGVYSASATGGNGFARDFLAGVSAMYATVRLQLCPIWSPFDLLTVAPASVPERGR